MKITRVDHIGIAVKSISESLKVYEAMGLKSVGVEEVAEQKVRVAFLPLGEAEIELLESTSPDGPVAKYIEKNGEGIQHLALRVDNLEAALAELKAQGVRLIDEKPREGAHGALVAFIHPKATYGLLLELCQYPH
jgi:methylmalonyl-CoA/ethylmalonyl-CoA epimerase